MNTCFEGLDGLWGKEGDVDLFLEGPDEIRLYGALREKVGLLICQHQETLEVHGKDSADFLQRMTSQDCLGMEVGSGGPACLMTGKGKLIAFFDLFRTREDAFLLLGQGAWMGKVREHLDLFHFREEMTLGPVQKICSLGLFGKALPGEIPEAGFFQVGKMGSLEVLGLGGWLVPACLLLGKEAELKLFFESFVEKGQPFGGFHAWEGLRIDSRLPRLGVDADESNIPLEVRLDPACHPEKGCYVGQEVVARIRNLGHVNRLLCLLCGESEELPMKGSLLFDEDLEAGRVTSAFRVPGKKEVHMLALLPRVLAAPGTKLCLGNEAGPSFEVKDPAA